MLIGLVYVYINLLVYKYMSYMYIKLET